MTSEILAKIGFVLELKQKLKEKNEKKRRRTLAANSNMQWLKCETRILHLLILCDGGVFFRIVQNFFFHRTKIQVTGFS